jgi:hypothetical protein
MTLPVGTYAIDAHGATGLFHISGLGTPDSFGNQFLSGTVAYTATGVTDNIVGFWDEAGQHIAFQRLIAATPAVIQSYEGTLFVSTGTGRIFYTLQGEFLTGSITGAASAFETALTWCAQAFVLDLEVLARQPGP